MTRTPTHIRADIETLIDERALVLHALNELPHRAPEYAPIHVELDKRIGWLWEELRVARSPRGFRLATIGGLRGPRAA